MTGSKYAGSNPKEPKPPRKLPEAPDHLGGPAQQEWERLALVLYNIGVLKDTDRGAMAAYCQAYGVWVDASRAMAAYGRNDPLTKGLIYQTKSGNVIQHPMLGVMNKARHDMLKAAIEMGLTPSARSRIIAEAPEDDDDPAGKYFN
jgi:P27 family predicted phage terminase small subunit